MENCVFDLMAIGGTGLMLDITMTHDLPRPVTICRFDCRLPWDLSTIWLTDPHELDPGQEYYRMPNGYEFPRNAVLNHRIRSRGKLTRGQVWEGLLLGWGQQPIPRAYLHGMSTIASISIVDQLDEWHSAMIQVWVDRSAHVMQNPVAKCVGEGLFARDEKLVGVRELVRNGDSNQGRFFKSATHMRDANLASS
jgi:hypothetical protein